jgi:hypothetical protein
LVWVQTRNPRVIPWLCTRQGSKEGVPARGRLPQNE